MLFIKVIIAIYLHFLWSFFIMKNIVFIKSKNQFKLLGIINRNQTIRFYDEDEKVMLEAQTKSGKQKNGI